MVEPFLQWTFLESYKKAVLNFICFHLILMALFFSTSEDNIKPNQESWHRGWTRFHLNMQCIWWPNARGYMD